MTCQLVGVEINSQLSYKLRQYPHFEGDVARA